MCLWSGLWNWNLACLWNWSRGRTWLCPWLCPWLCWSWSWLCREQLVVEPPLEQPLERGQPVVQARDWALV